VTTSFIPLETAASAGFPAPATSSLVETAWGDDCGANALDWGEELSDTGDPSSVPEPASYRPTPSWPWPQIAVSPTAT
jgi:hypothetical protein